MYIDVCIYMYIYIYIYSSARQDCDRILLGNAPFGEPRNNRLDSRSQTSSLKGQRPRPHVHRRDKQRTNGKQQTWQEVSRGAAPGTLPNTPNGMINLDRFINCEPQ